MHASEGWAQRGCPKILNIQPSCWFSPGLVCITSSHALQLHLCLFQMLPAMPYLSLGSALLCESSGLHVCPWPYNYNKSNFLVVPKRSSHPGVMAWQGRSWHLIPGKPDQTCQTYVINNMLPSFPPETSDWNTYQLLAVNEHIFQVQKFLTGNTNDNASFTVCNFDLQS